MKIGEDYFYRPAYKANRIKAMKRAIKEAHHSNRSEMRKELEVFIKKGRTIDPKTDGYEIENPYKFRKI